MFYIKLDENMNLVVTNREPLYRGDNLNRKIIYLIPLTIGELDPMTSMFYISYIRADGAADVIMLERMEDMYNDAYYQYTYPDMVNRKLTKFPGEVCTWLQVYSGDPSNPMIAKSAECMLQIQESKNMDEYLQDCQITALYQISKKLSDTTETVSESLEQMNEELAKKADNIIFNEDDGTIQLTANGEPIGDRIFVNTYDGTVVTNAGITTDNELILTFSDGSMKNLGKISGVGGIVYVPHISDNKILSFTIETEATEVPDPVDLNPNDEWSPIDDSTIVSDYVWEKI